MNKGYLRGAMTYDPQRMDNIFDNKAVAPIIFAPHLFTEIERITLELLDEGYKRAEIAILHQVNESKVRKRLDNIKRKLKGKI